MTPHELAQALGGAHKEGPHWRARCPAHDDHEASLDIREGRKVPFIFTCRAGCTNEAIIAELKAEGARYLDLFAGGIKILVDLGVPLPQLQPPAIETTATKVEAASTEKAK